MSKKKQDSRVGRSTASRRKNASSRSRNSEKTSVARRDRAEDERLSADTERTISDEQRLDEFRKSFFQSVLPDLPTIRGYHVCWLTTTNPRDSIVSRVRLGYEPVKAGDVPGFESMSLKTGEYAGCIGVNEMVAFKLPMHLYEAYMREAHHTQPLYEEEKLTSVIEAIEEEAARTAKRGRKGIRLEVEPGMAELGQDLDPGSFAENLGETR